MDGRLTLPKNTVLGDSYRIERVIAAGGFGITYQAEDIHLGTRVAIKEYYPEEFGTRDANMRVCAKSRRHEETFDWGLRSFLQEARTLARFRHPSVVQVTRVFEAHATAYMVMALEPGPNFEIWLRALGRPPTQEELDRIAAPMLDALKMMHAENFLHRDIAPDNIIVRSDGTPVLLDFGAARQAVAERSRTLTGLVKSGYSPFEQYATDGRLQGPWTDLYALGATLYRAVAGTPPEEATLRMADDRMRPAVEAARGDYRPSFLRAIDACLRPKQADRPQGVAALRPILLGGEPLVANITKRIVEARKTFLPRLPILTVPPGITSWRLKLLLAVALMLGYAGLEYARQPPMSEETKARSVWNSVVATMEVPPLEKFIERFGETAYGARARSRLADLKEMAALDAKIRSAEEDKSANSFQIHNQSCPGDDPRSDQPESVNCRILKAKLRSAEFGLQLHRKERDEMIARLTADRNRN